MKPMHAMICLVLILDYFSLPILAHVHTQGVGIANDSQRPTRRWPKPCTHRATPM